MLPAPLDAKDIKYSNKIPAVPPKLSWECLVIGASGIFKKSGLCVIN